MVECLLAEEYQTRQRDFKLALTRDEEWNPQSKVKEPVVKLHVWCLNPGVTFSEVSTKCRSVILTSGTLTPMESLARSLPPISERNTAPAMSLTNASCSSPPAAGAQKINNSRCTLSSSFQNKGQAYFIGLGESVVILSRVIPDGVLVFFNSYPTMQTLIREWKANGIWSRIEKIKQPYVEPRGSDKKSTEEFEKGIATYRSICEGKIPRRNGITGAIYFAVHRGKVAEGIDFADRQARAVLLCGIPFPHFKDQQIKFKKKWNDKMASKKEKVPTAWPLV
eukprot:TRINITY_DN1647_c0_g1_i1.p1 TRINITY_DN1647_c0_g1~~TRINITY_DN1647_c0_g1_i1.p1  ORF type:complete len:280 (+),score=24.90 TRINITY_DN1647_c0_g1_i1:261-1100(+)